MLAAAMLLPFASQAQNTLTVADGTNTNSYVPVYGLYVDDFVRCQTIYPAGEIASSALAYDMTGGTITGLTYYLSTPATDSWGAASFVVKMMEVTSTTLSSFVDMTNATTVYTGSLDATQSTMEITFSTPYVYQGGNLLIEIYNTLEGTYKSATFYGVNTTGASWQGNNSTSVDNITGATRAFIPKTTFTFTGGTEISCRPVTNLHVDDLQTTPSSLTLSWTDNLNTSSATYSVYAVDATGSTLVQSNIADTTYTVTGLNANTEYTFGVVANCSATDEAAMQTTSGRTACSTISLPYTDGFEVIPTGSYQMPFCWNRYTSAFTTSTTYPYSYSSGAHTGSRSLYFYGTTGDAYPDTMVAIMPQLDVTVFPMNSNRVTFWAKMGAASNSKNVYVGTLTDPNDPATFTLVDSVLVSGNTYTMYSVSLNNANATDSYVAFVVLKGTGTMYIDDVTLEEMPSCLEITNLTASDITSSSITLTWNDNANSSATYTVYNMADTTVIASNITATPGTANGISYTVTGLDANTQYTFGVQANCTAGDAAIMTVSARTSCATESLPFTEDFSVSISNNPCWRGANIIYAAGVTPTLGSITGWSYQSSVNNGFPAGHYRVNIYGTSCKYWLITPSIDFTTATNPLLTFDAAFTVYSSTSSDPANTTDIADDKFMILASTDDGATWTTASVMDLTQLASSSYLTQYVDLSAFAGETVRIAFYAESTVSGGDNNLHIDNISIDESTGDICFAPTSLAVSNITETGATLTWEGTANSYNVYAITATDTTFVQNVTNTTFTITGLNAMSNYTYGVESVCGSDLSNIMTISFSTPCAAINLPYTETFESTSATRNCWELVATSNIGGSNGMGFVTVNGRETLRFSSFSNASDYNQYGYSPVMNVSSDATGLMVNVVYATYSASDILNFGYITATDTVWDPTDYTTTGNNDFQTLSAMIPASATQLAVHYYGNCSYYAWIDSVSVVELTGDYCYPVSSIDIDDVTANSVTLSWSDANNTGATYTVYEVTAAGETVIASNISGTTYTVTGLNASTDYTFGVVANCSATSASSMSTVSIATGCANGSCNIYIYAQDGYGDGWNGNGINVMYGTTTVNTYSMPSQNLSSTIIYDTAAISVCVGQPLSFSWVAGQYPDEVSFDIANANGTVLFSDSGSNMTAGTVFFTMDSCTAGAVDTTATTDSNLVHITFAVNDATMGTTNPAPGTYTYNVDETFTLSVIPNTGYRIVDLTADLAGQTYHLGNIASYTDSAYAEYDSIIFTAIFAEDCPDSVAIPYVETFETVTGCWTTANTHVNTGVMDNTGYQYSGNGVFVFNYNTNPPQYFITPRLAGTGNGVKVDFYYRVMLPSYPESFQIGYSTTTNDTSAFVWGVEQTNLTNTTYAHYSEVISVPGVKYVSLRYTANDMYYLFVDDFSVSEAPNCLPITNLTLTASTTNSVTLSWTDAGNTGATYTIYDMNDTSVVATGITTTSYTVANLATATNYTFGVAANCSATETSNIITINVGTECDIISTFPYTQDFNAVPNCWTMIDADGDGYCWELITGGIHSASYDNNVGALTPDNWLITPQFQLAANTNYEVTWNANPQDASWPAEHYGLYVSTTSNTDTNAFTLVQEWTLTSAGHVPVVNLSSYAGQNIYLAFRHWNCTDMFRIAIDNFELREAAGANQITVTLTQNNPMYGSVSGSGIYTIGDNVTVSATPAENYQFSRWMDAAGSVVSTANPYTFVAATDITLQAIFISTSAETLTITADVNDSTMGYTTGSGDYTVGDAAVLTAYAYNGYNFVNWTSNGIDLGSANPLTITVTNNSATYPIIANFEPNTAQRYLTLTTAVNDPAMGTMAPAPGTYQLSVGDTVDFIAFPNEGYRYASADVTVSMMGVTLYDTTVYFSLDYLTLVVEPEMLGTEISVTVNFEEGDPIVNNYLTLVTAVNDPNMGTITPAPGTYQYALGESINFSATPNDGYHLDNAHVTASYMGMPMTDTVFTDITDLNMTVTEMMIGFTINVTVNFARNNAINVAGDLNNINIYPNPTYGIVNIDAEDVVKVDVMDLNGRKVATFENSNSFDLSNLSAGTYMLRIETANGTAVKRIVKK